MLKKEANEIVGGLSAPGKMPCPSINLPAVACVTGSKLARVPGTTCHGCYALKGRYNFKYTKIAMARRLAALKDSTLGPGYGDPDARPEALPLARLRRHPVSMAPEENSRSM